MNNQEDNQKDLDQQFIQLQKQRQCLHIREKFYQQLSKKKTPHLAKSTQKFFYTYLIKQGENKCLCECLNNLRNIKENHYYQLSQSQRTEIKELKDQIKKLAQEKNKINKSLIKVSEILNKLYEIPTIQENKQT